MSYDLRVWCRRDGDLYAVLLAANGWLRRDKRSGLALERARWQVLVSEPQTLEPEDVPAHVSAALPGPRFLVEVSLEPIDAPSGARKIAIKAARDIASALSGGVEDPQEDSLALPRGVKRFVKPRREERWATLELSWWYSASPLRSVEGVRCLLAILGRHMPEAVPKRYGLYEIPQTKTENAGLEQLAAFMCDKIDDSPIYYSARPVVGFHIADCDNEDHPRLGFRSNHFNLSIELDALKQCGWDTAVRNLWREVSAYLSPFYGEARVVRGNVWVGATAGADVKTDVHPVRSWFWRGIPPQPGVAMVVGAPYADMWKPRRAMDIGDLTFVEPEDWGDPKPLVIEVPDGLAQRWMPSWTPHSSGGLAVNWCDELPPSWPFA